MRSLKFTTHPVLVVFTAIAFLFLVTGCTRTVTKYDSEGKPYSDTEPDPWGAIGGIILTALILGAIAASANSDSDTGSFLYGERPLFAYAGNKDSVTDVSSCKHSSVKCFKLVDAQGNLISKHLIDINKLQFYGSLVDISEVQISADVDKRMLKKITQEIAKANNLKSVPNSLKAEVSFIGKGDTLKVDAVTVTEMKASEENISELTLVSNKGIYRVTTTLPQNSESQRCKPNQLNVTVSQLH